MKKLIFIVLIFFNACMTAPQYYEGQPNICVQADRCMYLNKDNPDKSVCLGMLKACRRTLTREYCKGDKDPNDCWKSIE